MDKIKKDTDAYKKQFSKWDKVMTESKVKSLEELYKKVHTAIRANPLRVVKPKKAGAKHTLSTDAKEKNVYTVNGKKYRKDVKITIKERKARVQAKIEKYVKDRQRK